MADNYGVLDKDGSPVTKASKDFGAGVHGDKTLLVDETGAPVDLGLGRDDIDNSTSVIHAGYQYEVLAAGQSATAMGAAGAAGDLLYSVIITPATTTPGDVTITDNAGGFLVWSPGTLTSKASIQYVFNAISLNGAWKIATGSNVSIVAIGDFT